jgi:ribose transport system permease protein
MNRSQLKAGLLRLLADYGMLQVLLLLCVYYSIATLKTQYPVGAEAGAQLTRAVEKRAPSGGRVIAVLQETRDDESVAVTLRSGLQNTGREIFIVQGDPAQARAALQAAIDQGRPPDLIVCTPVTAEWTPIAERSRVLPALADVPVLTPEGYIWPIFLTAANLLNIPHQIAIMAILAAGMTLVILTGGIDLSVGSVVALSAVTATLLIRDWGGRGATSGAVVAACVLAVLACACLGFITGVFVVIFDLPSFIVTLAGMSIASGLAYVLTKNLTIDQVPAGFEWLGTGVGVFGIPHSVLLALAIYAAVHVLLTRMTLGRYIYAVGGNAEAARLSGVPVRRVLLFVYTACAALAGLGGVVLASQFQSGAANYGQNYELNAIAAVAVGGTSLRGGEGSVLNTLAGAFVLGVINNGMNLTNVSGNSQRIVLGAVILGAVTFEAVKKRGLAGMWTR